MSRRSRFIPALLMPLLLSTLLARPAASAESQYRAAMTKIFLGQYHSFPIFVLNPVTPGDVVQLDNETIVLDHSKCYPTWPPVHYTAIAPYRTGLTASVSIGVSVKGDLLSKKVAEIDASGTAKFARSMGITIDPLSEARAPDIDAIGHPANSPGCQQIQQLIGGKIGKDIITYRVLHGIRKYQMSVEQIGSLDAKAKSDLLALIMKAFALKEADISISGTTASFEVSESPDAMTLAITPAYYSADDVFWITGYLAGYRGSDLDVWVDRAIRASDGDTLREVAIMIRDKFFGNDYARARELWARRFARGEKMLPESELTAQDFRSLANFGAAMVLTQDLER